MSTSIGARRGVLRSTVALGFFWIAEKKTNIYTGHGLQSVTPGLGPRDFSPQKRSPKADAPRHREVAFRHEGAGVGLAGGPSASSSGNTQRRTWVGLSSQPRSFWTSSTSKKRR